MRQSEDHKFRPFETRQKVLQRDESYAPYEGDGEMCKAFCKLLAAWARDIKKQVGEKIVFRPSSIGPPKLVDELYIKYPQQTAMFVKGMACTALDWSNLETNQITSTTATYAKFMVKLIYTLTVGMPSYLRYKSVFDLRNELGKVLRTFTKLGDQPTTRTRCFEEFWDGFLVMSEDPHPVLDKALESITHVVRRKDKIHEDRTNTGMGKIMELVLDESLGAVKAEDGRLLLTEGVESKLMELLAVSFISCLVVEHLLIS